MRRFVVLHNVLYRVSGYVSYRGKCIVAGLETTNIIQGKNGVGIASSYLDFLQNVLITMVKLTKDISTNFLMLFQMVNSVLVMTSTLFIPKL